MISLFDEFIVHLLSLELSIGLILIIVCLMCLLKFNVNSLNLIEIGLVQVYLHFKDLLGQANKFTPLIFSIFIIIALSNIVGLLPEVYPITTNPYIIFILAIGLFFITVLNGLLFHTSHFLEHFFIPGLPPIIYLLLTPIELIIYCLRPIALTVRLSIAISTGHIVTQVFGYLASLFLPAIIFTIAICIFEIFIAILQAYLFAMLSSIYLAEQYN